MPKLCLFGLRPAGARGVGIRPQPVDASCTWENGTDGLFGSLEMNHVAWSVERDILLNPEQAGERLLFFVGPYAEAGGTRYDRIDRAIKSTNGRLIRCPDDFTADAAYGGPARSSSPVITYTPIRWAGGVWDGCSLVWPRPATCVPIAPNPPHTPRTPLTASSRVAQRGSPPRGPIRFTT